MLSQASLALWKIASYQNSVLDQFGGFILSAPRLITLSGMGAIVDNPWCEFMRFCFHILVLLQQSGRCSRSCSMQFMNRLASDQPTEVDSQQVQEYIF